MKLFKKQLFILLCLPTLLAAQPSISNCENFAIGTVLKFQVCDTTGIHAGNAGASKIWDFTSLAALADTLIEWMVSPASTTHGSQYPSANLVEKYSDGTFVYTNVTADTNYMVGYLDTVNNYTIHYPNSIVFAVRPITYSNIVNDSFTITFASSSINFNGIGVSTVDADGYGTLKLPNGTYSNVLRIKISQAQTDTIFSNPSYSITVSYVWFDNIHTSALLKIDSTVTPTYSTRSVEYLLDESITEVKNVNTMQSNMLFPNPAKDMVQFTTTDRGQLSISNQLGQVVRTLAISEKETAIPIAGFAPGLYYINFQTENYIQTSKLILEH